MWWILDHDKILDVNENELTKWWFLKHNTELKNNTPVNIYNMIMLRLKMYADKVLFIDSLWNNF